MEELIKTIAERFKNEGLELYEVGGHVRDSFLNRKSHDIDLATNAHPTKIKELLNDLGAIYAMGEAFGTIGLNVKGVTVEVTSYRKEVYPSNSRKPEVVFGDSLVEDLSRRDFTINAIARDPLTGTVVDPFGGLIDMNNRLIKVVGGNERFDEDPLRMLRAVRFACELGFTLDVKIEHPERLQIVSKERIREELNRILLSSRASYGWRKLCQTGLIYYIVPEFMDLKNIQQGKNHIKDAYEHSLLVLHKGSKIEQGDRNLIFRLACILHDIGKPETKIEDESGVHFYSHHNVGARKARKLLRRLRYDNETVQSVCHLIKYHMTPIVLQREIVRGKIKKRIIMRLVRRVGEDNIGLLMDLVKCDIRSSKNPRYKFMTILTKMVSECLAEEPESLASPIDGNEIMNEFSLKPGKFVGEIKNHLTNLVIDDKLDKDDREGAFAKAREYIDGRR
jgi:poly(A) polymerase